MSRVRDWCFTLSADHAIDFKFEEKIMRYIVVGDETGKDGYKHFQGYVSFVNAKTMSAVKKFFNAGTMHLEPRRGTPSQASEYCKKEKVLLEEGDLPAQGHRSDLADVVQNFVKGDINMSQLVEEHPMLAVQYGRRLKELRHDVTKSPEFRDIKVHVYWGPTRTGKTRRAIEENTGKYYKVPMLKSTLWFDGYDGQEVLIIDEFMGQIEIHSLLQLLDWCPLQLPTKGAHRHAMYTKVVITSNYPPDQWYPNAPEEHVKALYSRITTVVECKAPRNTVTA